MRSEQRILFIWLENFVWHYSNRAGVTERKGKMVSMREQNCKQARRWAPVDCGCL